MRQTKTKVFLAYENECLAAKIAELEKKVAELEAEKKASGRFTLRAPYLRDGKKCVAVPLPSAVTDAVYPSCYDAIGRTFGNGTFLSGSSEVAGDYEDIVEPRYSDPVPPYVAYFVRCYYCPEEGTSNYRIFGLIPIE
jgi:hypothetical protein